MKLYDSIYSFIFLKNHINIALSKAYIFQQLLKTSTKFNSEQVGDDEIKCLSKFSLGTGQINYSPIEGIKVFVSIDDESDKLESIVLIKTKIRFEMYFILVSFMIFVIVDLFLKDYDLILCTFAIFLVVFIWFFIVYRIQEKILMKKVVEFLKSLE